MKEVIKKAAQEAARAAIRTCCGALGTAVGSFIASVLAQAILGKGESAVITGTGGGSPQVTSVEEAPPGSLW